jgi:hypothetical protein
MSFAESVHEHFVPSHINSYRPHVLRKNWLMFFIAVIFVSEGLFASSLFVGQGTSVTTPQVAAVGAVSGVSSVNTFLQSLSRQLGRIAVESQPAVPWVLGAIVTLITVALLFAIFVHVQIQHTEMLFSGSLVALFALSLLVTNAQITAML